MPMYPAKNLKTENRDLVLAYLPGNSDLHNSSRSNVIELSEI